MMISIVGMGGKQCCDGNELCGNRVRMMISIVGMGDKQCCDGNELCGNRMRMGRMSAATGGMGEKCAKL